MVTPSKDLIAGVVAELQLYAKTNAHHVRGNLKLPLLGALCAEIDGGLSVAEVIDRTVPEAPTLAETRALGALFETSGTQSNTNLSGRKRRAASELGMSYDSFRRRRGGAPSPYDMLCATLAQLLLAKSPSAGAAIDASHASHEQAAAGEQAPAEEQAPAGEQAPPEKQPPAGEQAPEAASVTTEAVPAESVLSAAAPVGGGNHTDGRAARVWAGVAGVALVALAALAAFTFWPANADPVKAQQPADTEPQCQFASADAETKAEQARYAVELELLKRGAPHCVTGTFQEAAGSYFYDLAAGPNPLGGAVVRPNDDGGWAVVVLPTAPWISYSRLLASEVTSDVLILTGYATGEITPSHGGYTLETDGGGYFYGASPFTRFTWMPDIAYELWVEDGAENGPLGRPTSSIYIADGRFRGDFEKGSMVQNPDGSIESILSPDADKATWLGEDPSATMIINDEGHAWFIDDQLRRWWVPSPDLYACGGGEEGVVFGGRFGAELFSFESAGVVTCPLGTTGTHPKVGAPSLESYCWINEGVGAATELDAEGRCDRDGAPIVALEDICVWQFGPDALVVNEPGGKVICQRP